MGSLTPEALVGRHDQLLKLMTSHTILRWSNPKEYEPAHGLFVRIAEQLHSANAENLGRRCGFEGGFPDPSQILRGLQALPIRGLDKLEHWTPVVTPTAVSIAGETFRRTDWSVSFRRYCPSCLMESAHHRAWWDLNIVLRCPLHDEALTQERPDGSLLTWRDTDFNKLSNEVRRSGHEYAQGNALDSFEAYILGRLGVVEKLKRPDLDRLDLGDVVDLARWIGKLRMGGWQQNSPKFDNVGFCERDAIAAGYKIAQDGENSIVRLLCEVGRSSPDQLRSLEDCFGWIYPCVMAVKSRPGAAWILQLIREAAYALGINGLRYRYQIENRDNFTVRDVTDLTRFSRGAVVNLAKHARVEPRLTNGRKFYRFTRSQLEQMLSILNSSYCREDAARRVGLDQNSFDRLARKGLFGEPIKRCSSNLRQDRFHLAKLDEFVQTIIDRCYPMPAQTVPSTTLIDLIKTTAAPADEVFEQIFSNAIPLRTRWPEKRRRSSIGEVRVLLEDLPKEIKVARRIKTRTQVRPSAKSSAVICRARAAGILGLPAASVDRMTKLGIFKQAIRPNGKAWRGNIVTSRVAEVAYGTLSIADLGRILGRPTNELLEEAHHFGLFDEPTLKIDRDTLERLKLVSWSRSLASYQKESYRFSCTGFWRQLDWHLHTNQSAFMRKRLMSCDSAAFWTTSRKTPVCVSFGSEHFLEFALRIPARSNAQIYLERAACRSLLYEHWSGLEIEPDNNSGDYILTFGITTDAASRVEQGLYAYIQATLESFRIVSTSTLDQEQLLLLPINILKFA